MRVPATDNEWFQLFEEDIDEELPNSINPDSETAVDFAKKHAEQTVEITDLDIDLSKVRWKATWELKAKHGYYKPLNDDESLIKLSLFSLETNGWQGIMHTVRHELVHVWQEQSDECDTENQGHFKSHGESFEKWMDDLNVKKSSGKVLATWDIYCSKCNSFLKSIKKNKKKEIAIFIHENSSTLCDCQKERSDFELRKEGEVVDPEQLPKVTKSDLRSRSEAKREQATKEQKMIFLYNRGSPDDTQSRVDWNPEVLDLTQLPGIGERTVVKIGDELNWIDDLICEDELSDKLQTAVSSQYHADLREELLPRYQEAMEHRSDTDSEIFNKVQNEEDADWWKPVEEIGGEGRIEKLSLKLYRELSAGSEVRLICKDSSTVYKARVTEQNNLHFKLKLKKVGTDEEIEGSMMIYQPVQGKFPELHVGPGFTPEIKSITQVEFLGTDSDVDTAADEGNV